MRALTGEKLSKPGEGGVERGREENYADMVERSIQFEQEFQGNGKGRYPYYMLWVMVSTASVNKPLGNRFSVSHFVPLVLCKIACVLCILLINWQHMYTQPI